MGDKPSMTSRFQQLPSPGFSRYLFNDHSKRDAEQLVLAVWWLPGMIRLSSADSSLELPATTSCCHRGILYNYLKLIFAIISWCKLMHTKDLKFLSEDPFHRFIIINTIYTFLQKSELKVRWCNLIERRQHWSYNHDWWGVVGIHWSLSKSGKFDYFIDKFCLFVCFCYCI